ncbi:MAG: hypothetical protein ACK46Q_16730, partial [Hyphomonas sp.]
RWQRRGRASMSASRRPGRRKRRLKPAGASQSKRPEHRCSGLFSGGGHPVKLRRSLLFTREKTEGPQPNSLAVEFLLQSHGFGLIQGTVSHLVSALRLSGSHSGVLVNNFKKAAFAAAATIVVSACTSTEKVAVQQPQDMRMTCAELEAEFVKLDGVMDEASSNKGVNTANVAAVVFFWPAAVGNYMNASDAEKLVERRRDHLMGIYMNKSCASDT